MNPWKTRFDNLTAPDMKADQPEPKGSWIVGLLFAVFFVSTVLVVFGLLGGPR